MRFFGEPAPSLRSGQALSEIMRSFDRLRMTGEGLVMIILFKMFHVEHLTPLLEEGK
jgi:hypothetical protein